jgi:hypothetical protein
VLQPASARGRKQRLSGDAGVHREGIAVRIEHRAQVATCIGPVHIMLRVLFARANELDGTSHRLGNMDCLNNVVGDDLAAETAAEECHIHFHIVGGAADGVRYCLLTGGDGLDRSPNLDPSILIACGRVHRLERRMRDVGQHEASLHNRCRVLRQDPDGLTPDKRRNSFLRIKRGIQLAVDRGGRERTFAAGIEFNLEGIRCALGLPELIGNHADGVMACRSSNARMLGGRILIGYRHCRDTHDSTNAGHSENFGLVHDRNQSAGKGMSCLDGSVEHPRDDDVDAEDRAAVAFGGRIQARHGLADQAKLSSILERRR